MHHKPEKHDMPAVTHQPLDPENPDILYGSTSSLWDGRHPIVWGIKRIAALGLQGIEPYAKQIEDHRDDPLALKEKFDDPKKRQRRSLIMWHSPATSYSRSVATCTSATWAHGPKAARPTSS
jgi:hypothetical protein